MRPLLRYFLLGALGLACALLAFVLSLPSNWLTAQVRGRLPAGASVERVAYRAPLGVEVTGLRLTRPASVSVARLAVTPLLSGGWRLQARGLEAAAPAGMGLELPPLTLDTLSARLQPKGAQVALSEVRLSGEGLDGQGELQVVGAQVSGELRLTPSAAFPAAWRDLLPLAASAEGDSWRLDLSQLSGLAALSPPAPRPSVRPSARPASRPSARPVSAAPVRRAPAAEEDEDL